MPLNFDSSRAPLTPSDFEVLVGAVCSARDSDETNWIEWKSTLDLASADGKTSIARAVVGFANRMPEIAAGHCEGRAYMVVGAAPGKPQGVAEVDPVVLEARLRPYLGDDGPRWAPHWVTVEGRTVLVVEVAQPRSGDLVHHIRKAGPGVRDGDIFVRRGAATVPASSVELQGLLNRAKTTPGLHGIRVLLAEPNELLPVNFAPLAIDEWLTRERKACLFSLKRHIASQRSEKTGTAHLGDLTPTRRKSGISFFKLTELAQRKETGEKLSDDEEANLNAGMRSFQQGMAGLVKAASELAAWQPEKRTPEQYEAEIDEYLDQ